MIIVADIGGTNVRIATSRDGETLLERVSFTTPLEAEAGLIKIAEVARGLAGESVFSGVVLGVAGIFSPDRKLLVASPHLPRWVGQCTTERAEKIFDAPVIFENDSALGALGEAVSGAGCEHEIVAYITVGTGVGGARVTHGVLDKTHFGFEIGHQLISMNGETNELENFVSGSAFNARYGGNPREVHNPLVWEKLAQDLADGLYNTVLHWSPDVLVLGGSMMKDIPVSTIKERMHARTRIFPSLPEICLGELGDECGLHGALVLWRQHSKTIV